MKIIVANWKMNNSFDECDAWIDQYYSSYISNYEKLEEVELILCPPAIMLDYIDNSLMNDGMSQIEEEIKKQGKTPEDFEPEEIAEILLEERTLRLGAQDCHEAEKGSFTGSLSANMFKQVGCEYSIIGHSERRQKLGESSALVAKKAIAAANGGLTPIVCIGETADIRSAGRHLEFIKQQLLESISQNDNYVNLIVAYEPVWAIGSGQTPRAGEIEEVTNLIRKTLDEELSENVDNGYVLYGGSVTSANSGEILAINNIDGLLVGGASLNADEFIKIAAS